MRLIALWCHLAASGGVQRPHDGPLPHTVDVVAEDPALELGLVTIGHQRLVVCPVVAGGRCAAGMEAPAGACCEGGAGALRDQVALKLGDGAQQRAEQPTDWR